MSLWCASLLHSSAQEIDGGIRQGELNKKAKGSGFDLGATQGQLTKLKNVRISSNTLNFEANSKTVEFAGMVKLYGDNGTQIFADKAVANIQTEEILLTGNVQVYQGPVLYIGNQTCYNYTTHKINTRGMTVGIDPVLLTAEEITNTQYKGKTIYIGRNAGLTAHDVENPNFWLRADKISIYPNNKITFNNLKVYARETPICYLPYLALSLNKDLGYHFIPGSRSNWGPFLMNRYGTMLGGEYSPETGQRENSWLLSQWQFDLRALRGVGTGVDLFDTRLENNKNLGWLKLYYTNDLDPSKLRSGLDRGFVNEDRYRVEFKNRFNLPSLNGANIYSDINLTWLSDRYYLEDFEPRTYTFNPEPDNTIGLYRETKSSLAGVYARVRPNNFYHSDTRLPELFYERAKSPFLKTNTLYQSSSSVGFYREDLAEFRQDELNLELDTLIGGDPRIDEINNLLAKRDFIRMHTYHELSRSFTPVDGITITPKAGLGYTKYWQEGESNKSLDKKTLSAELNTSLKFSQAYNTQNSKWGVNQLMHVIRSYVSLSFVSTNELDSSFTKIDRLTPTTRPRTIDVGAFTAIDELNNWSIARIGVQNHLLTKRNGTHPWLTMNTYVDYFIQDPELNRDFSNLYNDIYWHPVPWMALSLETQFPIAGTGSGFTEFATGARFMPNSSWEVSFNYRLLDNHPTLEDSNRIDIRAYTRINDKWGVDIYQQLELDDSTLETQQYSIHRNFDSWIATLGVLHRDNRNRSEFSIILGFTLKELPSLNIPLTIDQKND